MLCLTDVECGFQGRPKGVTPKYSLKPLVPRLSELLGVEVGNWDLFIHAPRLSLVFLTSMICLGQNG